MLFFLGAQGQSIGDFLSIEPQGQMENLVLPSSHAWQMILRAGDSLGDGHAFAGANDFAGYVPIGGSSTHGYLNINTEAIPGGVTVLEVELDTVSEQWQVLNGHKVDFSAFEDSALAGTVRNCSGGITPWGTMITCEELESFTDLNGDGYHDFGWAVEVDPVTHAVVDHDQDSIPDKLWALGHFRHENAAFAADSITVYQGEDNFAHGFLFKFVAHRPAQLDSGDLYVLQRSGNTGTWLQVPNATQADRNRTTFLADSLGGTHFVRVEDVEVGPQGKVYFASTTNGRVYRFRDHGMYVDHFETFVDNVAFPIVHRNGLTHVHFSWPDNLAFDGDGNLWVAQDGGGEHLWVFGPGHTTAQPDVRIFTTAVRGGEPTGMTFTPDFKYMFMSFQHPFGSNSVPCSDVTGTTYFFDRPATFVFARTGDLGTPPVPASLSPGMSGSLRVYPNPAADVVWVDGPGAWQGELILRDMMGRVVLQQTCASGGPVAVAVGALPSGNYLLTIRMGDGFHAQMLTKE